MVWATGYSIEIAALAKGVEICGHSDRHGTAGRTVTPGQGCCGQRSRRLEIQGKKLRLGRELCPGKYVQRHSRPASPLRLHQWHLERLAGCLGTAASSSSSSARFCKNCRVAVGKALAIGQTSDGYLVLPLFRTGLPQVHPCLHARSGDSAKASRSHGSAAPGSFRGRRDRRGAPKPQGCSCLRRLVPGDRSTL
jgi:hypothetical protein